MCGICGIISKTPIINPEPVRKMQNALVHRGPDDQGEFFDAHVALAIRRLNIIDPEGGRQPLYNEDRSLVLVANGEIYNFIELRSQLKSLGHHFRTGSDCETILHLYEEYALNCLNYLRGMFSFALWDRKKQSLLLVRDRMGEKPLYLHEKDGQLVFASEIKALLISGLVPLELDPIATDLYFHYQYVPEPRTAVKGVYKLEAAQYFTIHAESWQLDKQKYWDPEDVPPIEGNPAEYIRAELEQISKIIVRSDVPVGVALSGGIDSSAVTALTATRYPDVMQAFSVGYPGRPACDERSDAKLLADHLSIQFHDVELSIESLSEFFPDLIFWSDEPIADISAFAQYSVAFLARQHNVPVLLNGLGGDELFWGYPWFKETVKPSIRKAFIRRYLPFLFPLLTPLARHISYKRFEQVSGSHRLPYALRKMAGELGEWNYLFNQPMDQMVMYDRSKNNVQDAIERVDSLYSAEFASHLPPRNCYELFTFPGDWGCVPVKLCHLEFDIWLRSNCLALSDRLSMASSVELRLPLVDHRLVETVLAFRKLRSDHCLPAKTWFIEAIRDIVPLEILLRPKRGFTPPVTEWTIALMKRYWPFVMDGYLVSENILRTAAVESLYSECLMQQTGLQMAYKILVMEIWCRQVFRNDKIV